MEKLGFFSRSDMGGYPDEEMKKALEEALRNMQQKQEPNNANFMQEVPDSHRFTLYGLKLEIEKLLKDPEVAKLPPVFKDRINYILTGLKNSQREDIEMI